VEGFPLIAAERTIALAMLLNPLGHLWTIGPRVRHAVRPEAFPESRPWETILDDGQAGPIRLTGHLRDVPRTDEIVVLVHGLGGCTESHYMPRGAAAAEAAGLACLRLNLRGSDRQGEDYYHAGLAADLHAALASAALERYRRIYVLGYSMGGHVALRLATEEGDPRLAAVAAVCAPVDLARSQEEIDAPAAWVYRRYLLTNLGTVYRAVAARRPVPFPVERLGEIRTFRDWDDRIVAPRHGFADAADYYTRASVAPRLGSLRVPALLLNSELDPMVPARSVRPGLAGASSLLTVAWLRGGGHVAFPRRMSAGLGGGEGIDAQAIAWLRSQRSRNAPIPLS
jgi:predicted alpha/beta-fold hydrolase